MPPKLKIPPNAKYQPQNPKFVGHDTGSTNPDDVRARLFVGCLNLEVCTRNDIIELFSMYGPVKAVTHFPKGGYAFVQYENPEDAEDAVLNLNRYMFQGIRLDVKVAQKDRQSSGWNKRPSEGWSGRRGAASINFLQRKRVNPNSTIPPKPAWNKRSRFGDANVNFFDTDNYQLANYSEDYTNEVYNEDVNDGQYQTGYFDPYASDSAVCFGKAAQQVDKQLKTTDGDKSAEDGDKIDTNIEGSAKLGADFVEGNDEEKSSDLSKKTALEKRRQMNEATRIKRVENVKQRIFENVDDEEGSILDQNDIPDILICGGCHLITSNAEFFYAHRQKECDRKHVERHEDEPASFSCFYCSEGLRSSWELLSHLGRKHKMHLYKEPELKTIEYPALYTD